jgi:O-antigen/teichoic acid export membrane protein
VGIVLQMTGLERKNAEILVTSSIGTVIAMAVLTHFYGGVGTAVGMSAGVSISNLRMWLVARTRTAYDPSIMGLFRRTGGSAASRPS